MNYTTLYNRARTGAVRVWEIAVDGDKVYTRFGQLDGKMQEVVDLGAAKNPGKKNEVSAEQDAQNMMDRLLRQKMRKGYKDTLQEMGEYDPFIQGIVDNLSFYKPQNSMNATMTKMAEEGLAWALKKYDGEAQVIVKWLDSSVDVFSRRMHRCHHQEPDTPWRGRFWQQAEEVGNNPDIPPGSILLCEATAGPNKRDRWYVAQVLKAKTPKALKLQEEKGLLHFVVWDVAWWGGEQVIGEMEMRFRLDMAEECAGTFIHSPHILVEHQYEGVEHLNLIAKEEGWEGWVIIDPTATYGGRGFNLRGKPDRPLRSCKLKPTFEADVICFWDPDNGKGKWGRGKHRGQVGSMAIYQYDADANLVYLCDCGGGLDDAFRAEFTSPEDFPIVAEVEYAERTFTASGDKTNALTHPRVVRVRHDKSADECVEEKLTYGEKG